MNIEEETVIITGGAGFIGSTVARTLLEIGAEVHIVDNLFAGQREFIPSKATFHEKDIRSDDLKTLFNTIKPVAIIHLAAIHYIPYCNDHPEEAFAVNVRGTRRVVAAARKLSSLQKLVFASSAAVYPPYNGPLSETVDPEPLDIYGETKLIGEDLVRLFSLDTGTPTATARLFNVYGPNETNPHLIPAVIEQLTEGQRTVELGNLTPKRDFIHVEDVASALVAMVTEFEDEYQVFNVGTGRSVSVKEIIEITGRVLDEEITIIQGESRIRESDRPNLQADRSRIEAELGWWPTIELRDGLQKLLTEQPKPPAWEK